MFSYKALIVYDGSPFFGWQKTAAGPSIQGELERAIHQMTQESCLPEAASRTDRGVHAEGQVIGFSLRKSWPADKLLRGLNAHLRPEIRIILMEEINDDFHPTLHAKAKEYHYRICNCDTQDPLLRLYSWQFRYPLDLDKMKGAAKELEGTHDFSAFANEPEENPICHLQKIEIQSLPNSRLQISMTGNRFLYKMARTLAGTLLHIGCGKITQSIPVLLASKQRKEAGITAPAHGLFLHKVLYDKSE